MMPYNFIAVRHGESEGNVFNKSVEKGNKIDAPLEFYDRDSSLWRLTKKGIEQAEQTGIWIRENLSFLWDWKVIPTKYYVSPYIRARETAAYLNIPDALWHINIYLRERSWGEIQTADKNELYPGIDKKRKSEIAMWWTPPGGESIADCSLRQEKFFDTNHRECTNANVVSVSHGEVLYSQMSVIEHWTPEEYYDAVTNPDQNISNCAIVWYSRVNPITREAEDKLCWKTIICPQKGETEIVWQHIERKLYTNDELLADAQRIPKLLNL